MTSKGDYETVNEAAVREAADYAIAELLRFYDEGDLSKATRVALAAIALELSLHRPPIPQPRAKNGKR